MYKLSTRFIMLIFLLAFSMSSYAQTPITKKKLREYRNKPKWKEMMADPNVNFHEASIAFEEFWRGKDNPEELMEGENEEENEGKHKERSFLSRLFKSEKTEQAGIIQYAPDYKKFRFWQIQSVGFTKPDGTVMSRDEIQELVRQELQNRKEATKQ